MEGSDYKRKMIEYLQKNLKKGYTEDSLRWALTNQGYSKISIEDALKRVHVELAKKAPILKDKPVIKYEIIGENGEAIEIKKSFWKKIVGF
jgi:hypothetical protein